MRVQTPSFGHRLRLIVFLVSGFALTLAGAIWIGYQAYSQHSQAVFALSVTAKRVATAIGPGLASDDPVASSRLLELLTDQEDVAAVAVFKLDGTLFTSTDGAQQSMLPEGLEGVGGSHIKDGDLYLIEPVVFQNRRIGSVYLHSELRRFYDSLWDTVRMGALVVAVAFSIGLVMALRMSRRIAMPLDSLLKTAENASRNDDYSVRVHRDHSEEREIGQLIDAFNSMLVKVEVSNRALRKDADYFMSLVEYAHENIIIIDGRGIIRYTNAATETLLGYSTEDVVKRRIHDLFHSADQMRLERAIDDSGEDRERAPIFEARMQRKDGAWRTHEVAITNLLHDPVVEGIVIKSQDITRRKAIEEESHRSREFLDAVFQNIPAMLFVKSADELRFVRLNRAAEDLLGYPLSEMLGKTDYDFFPKEQADFFVQKDRSVLESGRAIEIPEERAMTRFRGERILHTKKIPIYGADGTPRYLLGISEDITERRTAERALRISEERYRGVVEHAGDAYFLHDLEGTVLDVNQQACESLGYSRDELIGMTVPDFEMNFDKKNIELAWKTLRPGVPYSINGIHRRKDGSTYPVEVRITLLELHGDSRVVAMIRNVSERYRTERELRMAKESAEAASRAKMEFLANMSHEIRTPMNAAIGMTDLLLRTQLNGKQREYVTAIRNSGDLLLSVIDDILDFSKMEAGELKIKETVTNVSEMLESVLDILGYPAYSSGIDLGYALDPDARVPLIGDPYRLRQVLVNLVGNAVKFTPEGEVLVRAEVVDRSSEGLKLKFTVEDTGIGIAPEHLDRLFHPFSQVDTSMARRFGGTGLGLAIAKRLVEKMEGEIGVRSTHGKGSSFWFTVPMQYADLDALDEPDNSLSGRRLLVVEDRPGMRELLRLFAQHWRCEVDVVSNGDGMFEFLRTAANEGRSYDALAIDMTLPEGSGVDLIHRMRKNPHWADLPAVLLVPVDQPLSEGVLSGLEPLTVVDKPLRERALQSALQQLLDPERDDQQQDNATVTTATGGRAATAAYRVLIAEDNPVSRQMLEDMLRSLGYIPDSTADGEKAIEALKAYAYPLVLLDCQMPIVDGYKVAEFVRAQFDRVPQPVIIAVTADVSEGVKKRCADVGMDDYLSKPVRMDALAMIMDQWIPEVRNRLALNPAVNEEVDGQAQPPVTSPMSADIWEDLQKRGQQQPDFLRQLIHLFLDDGVERVAELRRLIEVGEPEPIARAAHAFKAGCLQLGARRLADICKELQKQPQAEVAVELFVQLEKEFAVLQDYLQEELARLPER